MKTEKVDLTNVQRFLLTEKERYNLNNPNVAQVRIIGREKEAGDGKDLWS